MLVPERISGQKINICGTLTIEYREQIESNISPVKDAGQETKITSHF